MKTYTIFAYILPEGANAIDTITAHDATTAAQKVRALRGVSPAEFEVIAVVEGPVKFNRVDETLVALAPCVAEISEE